MLAVLLCGTAFATDYGINATWPAVTADDWHCNETGWMTGFSFQGCWRGDVIGQVDSFLVRIHSNTVRTQILCHYDQPSAVLWEKVIEVEPDSSGESPEPRAWCVPADIEFLDSNCTFIFQYNVELDSADWFERNIGTDYWLSISALVADTANTAWGLASTEVHHGGFAASARTDTSQWMTLDYFYVPNDLNCDGVVDSWDRSRYLQGCGMQIFLYYPEFPPIPFGDADCNGIINLSDCVYVISWIYDGGDPPCFPMPYPPGDQISAAISVTSKAAPYICGDADRNEMVNVSDAVYVINFIFAGGLNPDPMASGDVQCDGVVNISDVVGLIGYIFGGGPAPCEGCER
jgi:hypothetical protein